MTTHVELRRGAYHDSVSLMQVSRAVAGTPGVAAAQVAMATELNVEVLGGMGFAVPAGRIGDEPIQVVLASVGELDIGARAQAAVKRLAGVFEAEAVGIGHARLRRFDGAR